MNFVSQVPSTVPASHSVTYSCTLTNRWSKATHPVLYEGISGIAHWSPPVLVAHSNDYTLWAPGTLASPGVESVAETGSTVQLEKELQIAEDSRTAGATVIGSNQFNGSDPPQTFADIVLTPQFPLLSTITMVAPSPDWFSGFYNVSPITGTNDSSKQAGKMVWYDSFEIESFPWDAGTETGTTYTINNDPEPTNQPIQQITVATVPSNNILLDPSGTKVLPMANWKCTLVDSSCSDSDELRFKNRKKRNCQWVGKRKTKKRCKKKWKGKSLSFFCPETCGKCVDQK
mmetsp:Transcript_14509/g.40350  ORF Transcript_14509/g.40350 Transcript_14509/m.40350 type:complete len:287 (+) Transcript_14509:109-969(+)|eukprot:CAMPEP_0172377228 /NCGR_PEP_ID=MMETSP1060-20121228/68793_1 /TAXON_ID=37318 /ORGANISM="Pseudo-nitzschia pungens, Strain cf. cingulata" /LENGTH=286 /DNA_ID=CAMNT_0013104905 /DNA_START=513 /DNA_END=1373 /DNA_ORIENTATION=+